MARRSLSRTFAAAVATALLLTACGGDDTAGTDSSTGDAATDEMSDDMDDMSDDDMEGEHDGDDMDDMSDDEEAAGPIDPVLAATFTTADGETATLADLAGDRPVLVETFATWCSTCRTQLRDTQAAAAELGDEAVIVALSVAESVDPAALAAYADDNGFDDIVFGVLGDDGLVAFEAAFGGSVLNPPATPKFRIGTDGSVSGLTTGSESAEEILDSLGA